MVSTETSFWLVKEVTKERSYKTSGSRYNVVSATYVKIAV